MGFLCISQINIEGLIRVLTNCKKFLLIAFLASGRLNTNKAIPTQNNIKKYRNEYVCAFCAEKEDKTKL